MSTAQSTIPTDLGSSAEAALALVEPRVTPWPDRARDLKITDDASNAEAGSMLTAIKALRAEVAEAFDPIVSAAHKAHKVACDQKKKADAPLLEAEQIIKRSMGAYFDEQQRLARIEAARLEREAREREEAARLEEAAQLEAAGQKEEAERVLVEEPPVPAFVPPAPPARVQGVAMREEWSGEVTDLKALCKAIGEGRAPTTLVTVNQAALNGLARSMKDELAYPGVRAVKRTGVAARAR